MDLRTVLTTDTVNLHLKGTTKEEIVDEMIDVLFKAGKVTDKDAARECVLDRERKMSTGMKHGIAIPHGKTDTVKDLVACIGISDNPVDFDSLDQEPCRIFIMTLSPVNKTGPHLQFLAEVSLLFKSPEKRQRVLKSARKFLIHRTRPKLSAFLQNRTHGSFSNLEIQDLYAVRKGLFFLQRGPHETRTNFYCKEQETL